MTNYYYIKTNRENWKFNDQPTDWDNFPLNNEQEFGTFTKNQLYWKNLKKGDVIIGHSSYLSTIKRGEKKVTPCPRISAIAIVTKEEHYSKELDSDSVTLKKIIEFSPIPISIEVLKKYNLITLEPFKLGSNRFTITKLSFQEFEKIINLIKNTYPEIKKKLQSQLLLKIN